MNRTQFLILVLFLLCVIPIQKPVFSAPDRVLSKRIVFQKLVSSTDFDFKPTSDKGFVFLGSIDTKEPLQLEDIVLIKTSSEGEVLWSKQYQGIIEQGGREVIETHDKGFAICGYDRDQVLLIKTDSDGNLLWNRTYGRNGMVEEGSYIVQTSDLGYLVLGRRKEVGKTSTYMLKTSPDGVLEWSKAFGNIPDGKGLVSADDEGYLFVSGNSLVKISPDGEKLWTKEYKTYEFFKDPSLVLNSIDKTKDGYYLFGHAMHHGLFTLDEGDYGSHVLIKTDFLGNETWQRLYGNPDILTNYNIKAHSTFEGGAIFSDHANVLLKTNSIGDIEWSKSVALMNNTIARQTQGAGYAVAGLEPVTRGYQLYLYVFEPDYLELKIESMYGETSGSGFYGKGNNTQFSVFPEIFEISEGNRAVFKRWVSIVQEGYNGPDNPGQLTIQENIQETANWELQYYLDFSSSNGGKVSQSSDWYSENKIIQLESIPDPGYEFFRWEDEFSNIISMKPILSLNINQTLRLHSVFRLIYHELKIQSLYGNTWGDGSYLDGENVSFGVEPSIIVLWGTKHIFSGWECYPSPCEIMENTAISIKEDTIIEATWKDQHSFNLSADTGGSFNYESGWYDDGTSILLEVHISPGYEFIGLYNSEGNLISTQDSMPLIIDRPINVHARLEKTPVPVTRNQQINMLIIILVILLATRMLIKMRPRRRLLV